MPVIGHEPKLELLQDFQDYVEFIGYPGPMTKTATTHVREVHRPDHDRRGLQEEEAPRAAMGEAEQKLRAV